MLPEILRIVRTLLPVLIAAPFHMPAGYVAAVTLDARPVNPADRRLALPRFLVTAAMSDKRFQAITPPNP